MTFGSIGRQLVGVSSSFDPVCCRGLTQRTGFGSLRMFVCQILLIWLGNYQVPRDVVKSITTGTSGKSTSMSKPDTKSSASTLELSKRFVSMNEYSKETYGLWVNGRMKISETFEVVILSWDTMEELSKHSPYTIPELVLKMHELVRTNEIAIFTLFRHEKLN